MRAALDARTAGRLHYGEGADALADARVADLRQIVLSQHVLGEQEIEHRVRRHLRTPR